MFILFAARPDLVRRREWTRTPWRRALRQFVFMTVLGFAGWMVAAYSKPYVEALGQFQQEHGRYPTREEEKALFDALKRSPGGNKGATSAPLGGVSPG